jgi:hypothetical protein
MSGKPASALAGKFVTLSPAEVNKAAYDISSFCEARKIPPAVAMAAMEAICEKLRERGFEIFPDDSDEQGKKGSA